jgi:hypothetical protein
MGVRLARPDAEERVTSCFPVMEDEEEPADSGAAPSADSATAAAPEPDAHG